MFLFCANVCLGGRVFATCCLMCAMMLLCSMRCACLTRLSFLLLSQHSLLNTNAVVVFSVNGVLNCVSLRFGKLCDDVV